MFKKIVTSILSLCLLMNFAIFCSCGLDNKDTTGIQTVLAQELQVGEIISKRTQSSKTYYLGNDKYSLDTKIGSAHYKDITSNWQEIDNAWLPAAAPWDWYMDKDGYQTWALNNFTAGQVLKFASQSSSVAFQPMELQWTNDLNQIQSISVPQNVPVSVTNEPVELLPGMSGSIGKIRWNNAYGLGRHFEWVNSPGVLNKTLQIDSSANLPLPQQYIIDGGSPALRLNFIFAPSSDLQIYVNGTLWNKSSKEQTVNYIEFKKDGNTLWVFRPVKYWDSDNESNDDDIGTMILSKSGSSLYVSVLVPYSWLQTATYPVFIDPIIDVQVGAGTDDGQENEASGGMLIDALAYYTASSNVTSSRRWAGLRWEAAIPQGATIGVCYYSSTQYSATYDDANFNIHFEKGASPATLTTNAFDITNRTRTTENVSWIEDSLGIGLNPSPSLVTPLQEVIDNYTTTHICLITRPNQDVLKELYARAYEYDTALASKLYIEYSTDIYNVSTSTATNMGRTGATANGYLLIGSEPSVWVSFEYGTVSGVYPDETSPVEMTESGNFSANITGLEEVTPYYFRAKGVGSSTKYGSELTFRTRSHGIFWTSSELTTLKSLKTEPSHAAIWDNIAAWAEAHKNDAPPSENTSYTIGMQIKEYLETMGFAYSMTDNPDYADAVETWMLAVSGWTSWSNYHMVSLISRGFSVGYCAIREYSSSANLTTIRNAMVSFVGDVYTTYQSQGDFTPNFVGTVVAIANGIGLAGFALHGDYAQSQDWIDFGSYHAARAYTYVGTDGALYEGYSYSSLMFLFLVCYFDALDRWTGTDLFGTKLGQTPSFFIYFVYNTGMLQFEDYSWRRGFLTDELCQLSFMYRLAAKYSNGYAQYFANAYTDQSVMHSYVWKSPNITPVAPTALALTKHFESQGYVIFRTGWTATDLLYSFKSGSSRAHAHPSQNEFGVYLNGSPITCGVGYVTGYEDLDATVTHNCMLSNGLGQGQEPGDWENMPLGVRGEIITVESSDPYYRYVSGNATPPYDYFDRLDMWLRHVVMVESSYFVMYDRVAASSAKQFDLLLQAPYMPSSTWNATISGNIATLSRNSDQLKVVILEPQTFNYDRLLYNAPPDNPFECVYLKIRPTTTATSAQFLTALFPFVGGGTPPTTTEVSVGNCIGAEIIPDTGELDLILFSSDGLAVDEWIELGGYYQARDGGSYQFSGTQVRAQFNPHAVMLLEEGEEGGWNYTIMGISTVNRVMGILKSAIAKIMGIP